VSVPAYDRYLDSGVEWLGAVPSHWSVVPLRSQFSELTDKNNGLVSTDYLSLVAGRGVMPYAEKGDIGNKRPDDLEKCKIVRAGNFVINSMNFGIGAFGVSAYDGVCSPVYVILRPNEKRSLAFLRWIFDNPGFRQTAQSYGNGILAHRSAIGWDELRAMPAAIPPLLEQAAIAAFLDRETGKIDALVEAQTRLIELLKEKRQAVISHAVTKGLDPAAPMKDSGVEWLGQVPAHWEVSRLKFVARIQTGVAKGKTYEQGDTCEVPYLRVANVQDGWIDLTDVATIELPAGDIDRYRLQAGDVLMNEGGDFDKLGRGAVWDGAIDPCVHQNHVFSVRPVAVSPEWLDLTTSSSSAQFFFKGRSKQSTNLASISSTNVMELPLLVPSADEQASIVDQVVRACSKLDDLMSGAAAAITLLQERRAALISAAVTGKIDVRGFAPEQAEAA
jgi:type I restriction enzyme S subunit